MREVPCPTCSNPAAAREPGRHRRRPQHRPGRGPVGGEAVRSSPAWSCRTATLHRRLGPQGDQRPARLLLDVGLDYLSIASPSATLAGGEAQRIRLATQIGSGLTGVLYVLDEPSIGLHQRDNHRLIETLVRLRDPRQHPDRGRARRGHHPHRRLPGRHRPRGRRARRPDRGRGRPGRPGAHRGVPDRPVHGREAGHRRPVQPPQAGSAGWSWSGCASTTSRSSPSGSPRGVHLRHRGVRVGQVDPGQRRPAEGADAGRAGRGPRRGATGRSPGPSAWTR